MKILTDNVIKYLLFGRSLIQLLCFIAFLLSVFFLSFPTYYLNLFFFIWMMLSVVDLLIRGKYRFELPNKNNIHLYLLVASYFWMLISVLWSTNMHEAEKLLVRRITFFAFPFLCLMGLNSFFRLKRILVAFIIGTMASFITVCVLVYMRHLENPALLSEIGLSNAVMYTLADYKHRSYFSLCLIMGIIFSIHLRKPIIKRVPEPVYYAGLAVLYILYFAMIYLSQNRMPLIILLAVSCYFVFVFLWKKKLRKTLFVFIILFLGGSFFLVENHRRMESFELDKEKLEQFDPRYNLWRISIQAIKETNKITGTGIGDAEDVFEEIHHRPEFANYFFPAKNPHNEFLKSQIELGVVGLLLLLALIISVFVKMGTSKHFIASIMLLWLLFMLIETIGLTSPSTYMFSLSMMLIYIAKKEQSEPQQQNEFLRFWKQLY